VIVVGPYVRDDDHGWAEIHPAWTITPDEGVAQAVPPLAAVATTLAGADAAEEAAATPGPAATSTPLPLVPITPSFVSVVGGRPGQNASVTVQAAPGALCSIAYMTPYGTASTAQGLVAKRADSGGRVAWAWLIGTRTNPGMGTVTVTCDGASASAEIVIGYGAGTGVDLRRREAGRWEPPTVSTAEATVQSAAMVERFHRMLLRKLRAPRDQRRSPVVVGSAGRVNVAETQVNVAVAET
jgi:hypothetical protein